MPLALAVALLGCASDVGTRSEAEDIAFVDSKIFDDDLREALAAHPPTVTVRFTGDDVTVNRIPERLDRWLYLAAKRYDGKVTVEPDPELVTGRGLGVGAALGLAIGAYEALRDQLYYRAVKGYDVSVYHAPGESRLTRVVFVRSEAS